MISTTFKISWLFQENEVSLKNNNTDNNSLEKYFSLEKYGYFEIFCRIVLNINKILYHVIAIGITVEKNENSTRKKIENKMSIKSFWNQ